MKNKTVLFYGFKKKKKKKKKKLQEIAKACYGQFVKTDSKADVDR